MAAQASKQDEEIEPQIAQVLEYRFGDGLVYLPKNQPENLLEIAKNEGFIDPEGYLTRKGRSLIAKYHFAQ